MAKIRTIKPELFRHETLFEAEQASKLPLRLAFAGLFTCCDREGRFRWRPKQLKLDVLPYDEVDFSSVLDALLACRLVVKYAVANEYYGYIPSWHKHQHINNREAASSLPSPEIGEKSIVSDNLFEASENLVETPVNDNLEINFLPQENTQEKNSESHDALVADHLYQACENLVETSVNDNLEISFLAQKNTQKKNSQSQDALVVEIFQFWQETLNHPQARLDTKRKRCIREAFASGYSLAQLREAIQGCALTPHNMGKNDRGERYDGLHIIFKNADNIERFIRNYHYPPQQKSFLNSPAISQIKARLTYDTFDDKQYTQTPIEHISWMQSG